MRQYDNQNKQYQYIYSSKHFQLFTSYFSIDKRLMTKCSDQILNKLMLHFISHRIDIFIYQCSILKVFQNQGIYGYFPHCKDRTTLYQRPINLRFLEKQRQIYPLQNSNQRLSIKFKLYTLVKIEIYISYQKTTEIALKKMNKLQNFTRFWAKDGRKYRSIKTQNQIQTKIHFLTEKLYLFSLDIDQQEQDWLDCIRIAQKNRELSTFSFKGQLGQICIILN
ncbi:hypothetical protein pb186bvf_007892 [Paramecium bursaria]